MRRRVDLLALLAAGCIPFLGGSPMTVRGQTSASIPDAQQCAVRVLDGFGYTLTDNRRSDGTVRGRMQQGGGIRAIDVVIYEAGELRTVSVTAGKITGAGEFKGPDNAVRADVSTLMRTCATIAGS